jgi:mono/diheme cytochrome c family protein
MKPMRVVVLVLLGAALGAQAQDLGSKAPIQFGKELFQTRGCAACHTIGGPQEPGKRPLDAFRLHADPLFLGATLWNHAPLMLEAATPLDPWPRFEPGEIEKLAEFLHGATGGGPMDRATSRNASAGSLLFEERCASCHHTGEGGVLPDLAARLRVVRGRADIAGLMWNHVPQMAEAMHRQKGSFPLFEGKEMAALFSFLLSTVQERSLDEEFVFPSQRRR